MQNQKQYILQTTKRIINLLEEDYRMFVNTDKHTYGSAASGRSRTERELAIAKVIEHLVTNCPDTLSIPDSILDAFDTYIHKHERRL